MEPEARRRRALITGVVLLGFSALYLYQTFGYSPGSEAPGLPNARTLPLVLVGVLVLLSGVLLWQARSSGSSGGAVPDAEKDARLVEEPSIRRLGLVLVMLLAYLLMMPYAGFVVSTVLLGVSLQIVVFRASWIKSIVISVVISGLTYWLFAVFLGVLLP